MDCLVDRGYKLQTAHSYKRAFLGYFHAGAGGTFSKMVFLTTEPPWQSIGQVSRI